jgi:hypothetical protein
MIGKSSPPSCNTWGSGERQLSCLLWEKEFLRWLWVSGICDHHTFCTFVSLFPPYELWRSDPVWTFESASSSQWSQPSQKDAICPVESNMVQSPVLNSCIYWRVPTLNTLCSWCQPEQTSLPRKASNENKCPIWEHGTTTSWSCTLIYSTTSRLASIS